MVNATVNDIGTTPIITVLMPVHATPQSMVDRAIESIRAQTFRDIEFLILDGSQGLTATLNDGLRRARGEFIARQDADDWSDPQRLELQLAYLQANRGTVLCGTAAWMHQQDGRPLWRTRPPETHAQVQAALPQENPFVHGSTMFRRDAALAIGGYREQFRCSQDYDFFWRLSEVGEAVNLSDALYHYRYSAVSISANKAAEQARAHRAARILAGSRERGEAEDISAAFAASGGDDFRGLLKQADHLMLAGEYRRALHEYAILVRSRPASAIAWAKLARCGVFVTLPPFREVCFR
jgi:glycosyltransferase involved in cell wall biosynthesis